MSEQTLRAPLTQLRPQLFSHPVLGEVHGWHLVPHLERSAQGVVAGVLRSYSHSSLKRLNVLPSK